MSISLTHKNPTGVPQIVRLAIGQSRALTLPKLCVMVLPICSKTILQRQNLPTVS